MPGLCASSFLCFSAGRDPTQIAIKTHTQSSSSSSVLGKLEKKQSVEQATHLHRCLYIFVHLYVGVVVLVNASE